MARPRGAQALRASRQKLHPDPVMGRGYLRSIFDRLLPKGRKKDWRGVWGVV
jgi:hypothetical protein